MYPFSRSKMDQNGNFERIFELIMDAIEKLNSKKESSFNDIVSCIKRRIVDSGSKPKPNFIYGIRTALQRAVTANISQYS